MNDNKLNRDNPKLYEFFDSKDKLNVDDRDEIIINKKEIYKDKLKLIFEEYKKTNVEKIESIKNMIKSCKEEIEFEQSIGNINYLQHDKESLNELLSYFE